MKKMLKCCFTFFVCISIIIFNCSVNSAYAVFEKDKAINVLLQAGWTMEDINDLLSDEALMAFKDVKNIVASDKKYLKIVDDEIVEITEDQCMQELSTINPIEQCAVNTLSFVPGDEIINEVTTTDGYLTYYVNVYYVGGVEYILQARYEWLKKPFCTFIDVFGLGHDVNLTQPEGASGVYYVYKADWYDQYGNKASDPYETYTPTTINCDPGGTVVTQDLQNDSSLAQMTFANHRAYMQYNVVVNSDAATYVSVYAEYLHQENAVSLSPSVSYPAGASISVSFEFVFKRMSPNPYLAFPVNQN